eukprot:3919163-Prymnesium_polylepis.1
MHLITSDTWVASRSGRRERSCATAPATCGHAIEVPEIVLDTVSWHVHAERMLLPGASTSTHEPVFEKLERVSDGVVEPTVIALTADAGDDWHASVASLPAATTMLMPAACACSTTLFSSATYGPPSDMDMTDRPACLFESCTTQSMPAIRLAVEPVPWQLST